MKCPKCKTDACIKNARPEVAGDSSPDEQTKVFTVLSFICRNPQCSENGSEIGEERYQVYPEK